MLIVCPSCATSYDVELASLQPNGRKVRCVRCRTVWHAEPHRADMLLAAALEIAPERPPADDPRAAAGVSWPAEDTAQAPPEGEWPGDAAEQAAADGDPSVVPGDGSGDAGEPGGPADEALAAIAVDAPPLAPDDLHPDRAPPVATEPDRAPEAAGAAHEDIETYAARQERLQGKRGSWRWPLSNLQSAILVLLIIDGILVGWRDEFVRVLPQTASFYAMLHLPVNLRGLAFDGVTTATEEHEGVPILVAAGQVVNNTGRIVEMPRLKFVVRNAAGEEIYSWTAVPPRPTLPPGEAVAFHSRLASPPPDGRALLVRFLTRRDIVGGGR